MPIFPHKMLSANLSETRKFRRCRSRAFCTQSLNSVNQLLRCGSNHDLVGMVRSPAHPLRWRQKQVSSPPIPLCGWRNPDAFDSPSERSRHMSARRVLDSLPSRSLKRPVGFVGVAREEYHPTNRKQEPNKLSMVFLGKLVSVCPGNPSCRDIGRIKKEQGVLSIESAHHVSPIAAFDLNHLQPLMNGRENIDAPPPSPDRRCCSPAGITNAVTPVSSHPTK